MTTTLPCSPPRQTSRRQQLGKIEQLQQQLTKQQQHPTPPSEDASQDGEEGTHKTNKELRTRLKQVETDLGNRTKQLAQQVLELQQAYDGVQTECGELRLRLKESQGTAKGLRAQLHEHVAESGSLQVRVSHDAGGPLSTTP